MPRLSLFNDIFREPWLIEPQTATAQRHVLQGVLMGLQFTPEDDKVQTEITHKQSPMVPHGRKVNVVELTGVMLRDDGPCGLVGTRSLANLLREADAAELQHQCLRKVAQNYSQSAVALRYVEVYNQALAMKHYKL